MSKKYPLLPVSPIAFYSNFKISKLILALRWFFHMVFNLRIPCQNLFIFAFLCHCLSIVMCGNWMFLSSQSTLTHIWIQKSIHKFLGVIDAQFPFYVFNNEFHVLELMEVDIRLNLFLQMNLHSMCMLNTIVNLCNLEFKFTNGSWKWELNWKNATKWKMIAQIS